ncbi:hypothetical protein TNCV_4196881 [Trichonephila clavipes]|nr:hypothetical protein TNCV_4196881 [Trichonephila clavipes]
MYPLHHVQNPYKIQTAPGYYYKTDELLRCFNKITTLQTFFFSPKRTWTAVRDQETVNQESVNQESVNQESVTRSPKRITKEFGGASGSTDLIAGKVMFLRSNQGGRLDGNKSVADSFRSDLFTPSYVCQKNPPVGKRTRYPKSPLRRPPIPSFQISKYPCKI